MSQSLFASLLAGSGLFVVPKRVESPPRDTEDPRSWLLIGSPTTRQCPEARLRTNQPEPGHYLGADRSSGRGVELATGRIQVSRTQIDIDMG